MCLKHGVKVAIASDKKKHYKCNAQSLGNSKRIYNVFNSCYFL